MAETFGTSGSQHGYLVRNANGQVQLAANIASELDSQKPDVVVAITTPMPQAVAKAVLATGAASRLVVSR
ncbi:MAG: hypothetical protein DME21_17655 [Verrucomicrobia bacterium]|nr:MAG: hypothetical protein DME21_17655 [Verrucomicrobiota bacterium]